jgi:hypothetical protein
MLRKKFGDQWVEYKKRTKRWYWENSLKYFLDFIV